MMGHALGRGVQPSRHASTTATATAATPTPLTNNPACLTATHREPCAKLLLSNAPHRQALPAHSPSTQQPNWQDGWGGSSTKGSPASSQQVTEPAQSTRTASWHGEPRTHREHTAGKQQERQRMPLRRQDVPPRGQDVSFKGQTLDEFLAAVQSVPGMSRRLVYPSNQNLPQLNSIVLVEGLADVRAAQRAVHAPVYVCEGSGVKGGAAADELRLLSQWPAGLVILTDPDGPGRELRMFLDEHLVQERLRAMEYGQGPTAAAEPEGPSSRPSNGSANFPSSSPISASTYSPSSNPRQRTQLPQRVLHAFVTVQLALSQVATWRHEVGSTGVENASPDTILASLRAAVASYPNSRAEFKLHELHARGLVNSFDAKPSPGAKLRRKLVCDRLGIDNCTGGSLLTMLNRFFERSQFEAAVETAAEIEVAHMAQMN